MSGLAHYFEDEGVPTVVVALLREQAERARPPRALWVPFPLGRPFGAPDDADQQRRVLEQALALLDAPSGPLLVDFDDSDSSREEDAAWVCPVRFPPPEEKEAGIARRVADEVTMLRPWYELGVERRGRTTLGLANATIEESAAWIAAYTEGGSLPPPVPEESMADNLRWSAEDLKTFYYEAATAQPGLASESRLETWFWEESAAGKLLRALRARCLADGDEAVRDLGELMLVPEAYAE